VDIKIGLLGGIGPAATGEFYLTLISKYQERGIIRSNEDFPQIVINSIPAPELIYENVSEEEIEAYSKGVRELERWGVDVIALICNTIYSFYEVLQKEVEIPIIDLRREMGRFLRANKVTSMAVLGTPTTIKKGLYRFEGINCWDLDAVEMRDLSRAIFNFNRGIEKGSQIQTAKNIAEKYIGKCNFLIAGCSEIGLMLRAETIPLINPMDVLAEAVIKYSSQPAFLNVFEE
jgi:aspartate racemase